MFPTFSGIEDNIDNSINIVVQPVLFKLRALCAIEISEFQISRCKIGGCDWLHCMDHD